MLHAAIIGVGNIAAFIDSPTSPNIASHTKAFHTCPDTKLVALYEPISKNIETFKKIWGNNKITMYDSLKSLLASDIDIVSITSSTSSHYKILEYVLHSEIEYILCEKPLVSTLQEFNDIEKKLLSSTKKIQINIIREYIDQYHQVKTFIESKKLSDMIGFHAVCTKGILHNGIHMLALIEQYAGSIKSIQNIESYTTHKGDLAGTFNIKTTESRGTLQILDNIDFSQFTLDIFFKNGKISFIDGGDTIIIYEAVESQEFKGYKTLQIEKKYTKLLQNYALDSLCFLIKEPKVKSKKILEKHLQLHKKIFITLERGQYEASN